MGKWQGQADPPLTDLGKRQAEVAAQALAGEQHAGGAIARVIASDLERARHTAEILAQGLGIADLVVDEALRERHAGEWEGLTRAEIEQQWPGAIAERRWPAHFESEQSVAQRLLPALRLHCAGLAAEAAVLMVGHAGVVKTVDLYVGAAETPVPNLAGRWYRVDSGSVGGGPAGGGSAGSGSADGGSGGWGWEHLVPLEQVQLVPADFDAATE